MKKASAILTTMLAAVLLAAAIGPASADGNSVAYNQVGVRFFEQQKVQAGEMFTASNGQQVPSSITYTDAAGGKTNYLSIRQIADMMDADIRWDGASGNVEIAGKPQSSPADITISTEASSAKDDSAQPREFGQEIGPFEEIDPQSIASVIAEKAPKEGEAYTSPYTYMKDVHIQFEHGSIPPITTTVSAESGQYLVYTVKNNGASSASSSAFRKPAVSNARVESFPRMTVAPGETLIRAFKVSEGANPLTYEISFAFNAEGAAATDMTVSLEQYQ